MIDARTEIKAWLKANHMTQKRLAETAGMTKGRLCTVLKHRDLLPSRLTRNMLAAVTGLDVSDKEAWE